MLAIRATQEQVAEQQPAIGIENNAGLGDLDHPKMVRYLIKLILGMKKEQVQEYLNMIITAGSYRCSFIVGYWYQLLS